MASTSAVPIDNDQVVHLSVSWEAYKALSASMGDESSPRLIYDGETLEIMSPGSRHERIAARIADLLSAIVTEWEFNIESTRSTTFEAQPHGFEGDDTYYIASAPKVRDWDNVSLATDPPPDLIIEIDISKRRFDKKALYARIGIPEFWRFDGESGLEAFALIDGAYVAIDVSLVIPGLPVEQIAKRLERKADRLTIAKEWQQWLRDNRKLHRG
jgi:Uma2 family endonuclease